MKQQQVNKKPETSLNILLLKYLKKFLLLGRATTYYLYHISLYT